MKTTIMKSGRNKMLPNIDKNSPTKIQESPTNQRKNSTEFYNLMIPTNINSFNYDNKEISRLGTRRNSINSPINLKPIEKNNQYDLKESEKEINKIGLFIDFETCKNKNYIETKIATILKSERTLVNKYELLLYYEKYKEHANRNKQDINGFIISEVNKFLMDIVI